MVSTTTFAPTSALEERRLEMTRRLSQHRKQTVWLEEPPKGEYRMERQAPHGVSAYKPGGLEPIVEVSDLYSLSDASFVTVNAYDALILNSKNLLIADIDFGNPRYEEHAGAANLQAVYNALKNLKRLDRYFVRRFPYSDPPEFSQQAYTVYRTAAGCRVICTSRPFPWDEDGWLALKLMRFLRADPQYMRLCEEQKCYRARLTPKPWRDQSGYGRACRLEKLYKPSVPTDQSLSAQLLLHAEISGAVVYPVCMGEDPYLA